MATHLKAPPHLCSTCYGWGFPITVFNRRVVYRTDARCPDCGGSGKPKPRA